MLDVVGEDEIVLGAPMASLRAPGMRPSAPQGTRMVMTRPAWMHPPDVPHGVSLPKEELDFLPFTFDAPLAQFTSTLTTMAGTSFPQRPFRGERVVASATLIPAMGSPTDVSDLVFVDPAIYVGAVQIGATQGATPLSTFRANAFGVRLSFPMAAQGTRVFLPLRSALTPAMGDVIQVSITIIGKAVR